MTALRKFRENKGLTQEQLAKELGVTASAVTQWESGARNPNIKVLKKLSLILGCTTDELLEPIKV